MTGKQIGLAGLILYAFVCAAQTGPAEPETADVFFRLDADKLIPLERQAAAFRASTHGFVVMNMKSAAELPGGKSPVRFKSGQPVELIVRSFLSPSSSDPNTLYVLRKLTAKKKTRELVMTSGHFSPVGGSVTTTPSEGVLPVEFSHYGASSLKMSAGTLATGEYAVGRLYGPAVFCFGVD